MLYGMCWRPAPPAKVASSRSSMTSTALPLPRFAGFKSVILVAARREVTLIFKALSGFQVVQSPHWLLFLSWKVTP
jgi:hypothetical protein